MGGASAILAAAPVIPDYGKHVSSCVRDNDTFCWGWFKQNWGSVFWPAIGQHIYLTVISVAIGFVIAFLLAVAAHFAHFLIAPVTFVTTLLYTVPSLAAFEILVPVTGIEDRTVIIPLTTYSLLILFTNTLAGLSGVSDEVLDAARGIGLTRFQLLVRVELPLAVPTIMAGLRVAVVTIISLATIAAFILPKGLGKPIFDAQGNNNFSTEFIAAGVLCVLLALVADALLAGAQRVLTPWANARRIR